MLAPSFVSLALASLDWKLQPRAGESVSLLHGSVGYSFCTEDKLEPVSSKCWIPVVLEVTEAGWHDFAAASGFPGGKRHRLTTGGNIPVFILQVKR